MHLSSTLKAKDRRLGYILIAPTLIILFLVVIYPLLYSFYISFHNMNVAIPWKGKIFVGFANYINVIQDISWWKAILRTLYFVIADILVGVILGLIIALLLNKKLIIKSLIFAIVLFPYVLPPIVNALMWKLIYDSNYGLLNGMLYQFGFINDYIAWLSKANLAIIMLIIANLWQGTPFAVILFLSGLKSIPLELYEAARIDGSSSWQSFKYITLPLLKPIIYILVVMKTILTFKIFDLIYALTGGGPANTTQVVSMKIYNESFNFLKFGRASAMSYILLGVVTCFVIIYMKLFEEKKETEN